MSSIYHGLSPKLKSKKVAIIEEKQKASVKVVQKEEKEYITISDNAIKNKTPMYVDTKDGKSKQIGYVLTGKTDFQDDQGNWISQYIELWVEILTITETNFNI